MPASYTWEATDEAVAERYGIPIAQVLRFDLNTSPAPPELLAGRARRGPVRDAACPNTRRATTAGWPRRPPTRTASRPTSSSSAPAPTRSSTCARRRSCPRARPPWSSVPTYAMYRVHAEQRGGRVIAGPTPAAATTAGRWTSPAVRAGRSRGDARLALQPEQPDRAGGTRRRGRAPARGHRGRRRRGRPDGARRRGRRGVQRVQRRDGDRAARRATRTSSWSGPPPRRTRSRAFGSGFAIAAAGTMRADRSLPPARVRSPRSPPPPSRRRSATSRACARTSSACERGASPAGRRRSRPPAGARSRRSPTSCCSTSSRRSARRRPRSR